MNLTKNIHHYWDCFLDLIYPRNCIVCQQTLHKVEEHICLSCELTLPEIKHDGDEIEEFKSRFYGRVSVSSCYAYLKYNKSQSIKRILKEIKYSGNKDLAEYMGEKMGQHFNNGASEHYDVLIPIPLHPKKEKLRGFNQSESIAMGFSNSVQIDIDTNSVIRTKNTKTQTQMDRNERWENVRTIFKVKDKEAIKGKSIIVLDDVVTTGSTLESFAQALLDAGAKKINFAVLAISI